MPLTLGANIAALQAQRRLGDSSTSLTRIYERLSSGLRINRASDDAAGLAVSESLNLNARVYTQGIRNGNDGQSMLAIADSTLESLSSVVIRIRELATQAANGSYSRSQRLALDEEAQVLSAEFARIARSTTFNGVSLFDGSLADGLRLQLGFGVNGSINTGVGGAIGTGTLSAFISFDTETASSYDVQLADLNGDGVLDMVTGGGGTEGNINVRFGSGNGSFGATTTYSFSGGGSVTSIALGDVNNDGIIDLVTRGAHLDIRLGVGDGSFTAGLTYSTNLTSSTSSPGLRLADVNGDGALDMLLAGTNGTGQLEVRLGGGNGSFGAVTSYVTDATSSNYLAIGDLNGDGILDIVTAGTGGGVSRLTVRLGVGGGAFGAATSYSTGGTTGYSVSLGDFNGDGILDLASSATAPSSRAFIQLGLGDGTFGTAVSYTMLSSAGVSEITTVDINGDGNLDLVMSGNGGPAVRLGAGDGTFGAVTTYGGTAAGYRLATGDLNGDGVVDIIAAGEYTLGGAGAAHVYLSNTRDGLAPLLEFSLRTQADALQSLGILDRSLANLAIQRGEIGAHQSRVNVALSTLQSARDNFIEAGSQVRDSDIASDSADLIRNQILQRAATSILAQANQQPSLVIRLLS